MTIPEGTRVDEVHAGLYRISTAIPPSIIPGGFTFNRFLLLDDEPLLFHTGPRAMAPATVAAIASVVPVARLRWVAYSHYEDDESGAMDALLAAAPRAEPLQGRIGAMINGQAFARPVRGLADGEVVSLGQRRVRWLDTPHVPHSWDCGFLFEETSRALLCGDLFTHGGAAVEPLVTDTLVERGEPFRQALDYFSHGPNTLATLERLATLEPALLACMHGASFAGSGAAQLRALARAVAG
jgi:flavorubredoxin